MQIVRFTKFWPELSVTQMAQRACKLGYDGFDLAVRDGHPISPANAATDLSPALRIWQDHGLTCPLITAGVDCNDANDQATRRLFAAAGEAGVANIKIGYFQYQPGDDFEATWANAKERLSEFESLAAGTGVRALYHTHSGLCLGSNCSGLRHLLEHVDPVYVGAYPDLGHLAINGEDARLGLAMLGTRIGALSAKDAHHVPETRSDGKARFADGFVLLGHGAAEIGGAIDYLKSISFTGPISVHTEYTLDQAVIETVGGIDASEQAETLRLRGEIEDLAYLRNLL